MCVKVVNSVANSVVLNVRRVIVDTRKYIKGLIGDFVDCGACFHRVRNVEVKPLTLDGTPALPGCTGKTP